MLIRCGYDHFRRDGAAVAAVVVPTVTAVEVLRVYIFLRKIFFLCVIYISICFTCAQPSNEDSSNCLEAIIQSPFVFVLL